MHQPLSPKRQVPASMAFITDNNRPPTALATSSHRLPNRLWGRLCGPLSSHPWVGGGHPEGPEEWPPEGPEEWPVYTAGTKTSTVFKGGQA